MLERTQNTSVYNAAIPPVRCVLGSRGITYYTLVSDQFTQLHGQVIPGTIRDSLYILSALLEQPTTLKPKEVMTDTGAYSDVIFGLFFLLGFKFSPRLKDAGSSRFWRINRDADYGVLNDVARNKINTNVITQHWEDVLRLVGSLKLASSKLLMPCGFSLEMVR